jgi:outer membrane protein assembly factor BamB
MLAIALLLAGCVSPGGAGWRAHVTSQHRSSRDLPRIELAVDATGDVIAAGSLGPAGSADSEDVEPFASGGVGVVKLSGPEGRTLWRRTLAGTGGATRALVLAGGRDPIVGGSMAETESSPELAVVRLDGASGEELWRYVAHTGDTGRRSAVTDLALDPHGEVIAAGFISYAGSRKFSVFKLAAADGRELWRHAVSGDTAGDGTVTAIATTPEGDPIVAGSLPNAAGGRDPMVLKIDGLDGVEIWRRILPGGTGGAANAGEVRALSLDRSGDVVAARLLPGASRRMDLVVARLDGRNGGLRWEERIEGGAGFAMDLAVDAQGQILTATASPAGFDITKLASRDGRQIWRKVFRGPAGAGCDEGVALSLDSDDDVIAIGLADGCATGRDLSAVKLAARDGRSLWQRSIGTAAGISGLTRTLALDARDDIVVAGYLAPSATRADLVVVKLRGRDGRLPRKARAGTSDRMRSREAEVSRGPD